MTRHGNSLCSCFDRFLQAGGLLEGKRENNLEKRRGQEGEAAKRNARKRGEEKIRGEEMVEII